MTDVLSPKIPLFFGTWQAYDHNEADPKQFALVIEHAIRNGITHFDTAEAYGNGESEKLLGRCIKGKRDKLIIASKFSHHHSRPDLIEKSLMKSLKRLGTEHLDITAKNEAAGVKTGMRSLAE